MKENQQSTETNRNKQSRSYKSYKYCWATAVVKDAKRERKNNLLLPIINWPTLKMFLMIIEHLKWYVKGRIGYETLQLENCMSNL